MQTRPFHHRNRARAAAAAAGTLLALISLYYEWKNGAPASLVPAILLVATLLSGWRLAAASVLMVALGALALQGVEGWSTALPAVFSVACAEGLRRGLVPLLATPALLLASLGASLLAHGLSMPLPLIAGAIVQAGAGVGAGCLALVLLPRRNGWTPARCRIRWAHMAFCLVSGSASLTAMGLLTADSDAAAALRLIGVMTAAFFTTQLLTRWLESATLRLGERYMSHRALAAAGIAQRRIRELPVEVLRLLDRLHRDKSHLRRSSGRAGRRLVEAQRTSAQALHELHSVRETMELKSSRLHALTRIREDLRERLQVLLESSADVHIFVSEQGLIEAINGSSAALLGHAPAALSGKPVGLLVPTEHMLDHPLDLGSRRQLDGPTGPVLCQILLADGSRKEVSAQVHPFPIRENRHYLIHLREPDHMKNALATLEEARELTRDANQSRDLFVATMSHELRTPLHGLIATLDMLRTEDLEADLQHHLAIARSSARALLKIANDVLDLSRLRSNLFPLERKLFALPELLRESVDEAQAHATTLGLSVAVDITDPLPISFWGDPARIKQILGNLVSNALKFTSQGGVTLQVGWDGGTCTIDVEDTGEGIPQDKIEQIFDPFVQLKSRTAKQAGGAGLGLPISRRIAEAAGGNLVLLKSGSRGSTFRLTLPLEASDEIPPDEQSQRVFSNPRGRILVVEDNPANRYVAQALLAGLKCPATIVKGGREALDLLSEEEFDLILMDCQMPGMDGYETTRRARRLLKQNIPIIAMTANAMAEDRNDCLAAGMDDFLPKPFGRQALSAILSKWLDPQNSNYPQATNFEARVGLLQDLDEKVLDELWESLRWQREPLRRICSTFSGSLQAIIAMLDRGSDADRAALLRQLHALLGSSGMVGARRIEFLAGRIQAAVKDKRPEELRAPAAMLRAALLRYERALARKLDGETLRGNEPEIADSGTLQ